MSFFEDNTGAEHSIVRGMSKHSDLNILLSLFWGCAAQARAFVWADRVSSHDNPADSLTKPGLDRSHLRSATDMIASVAWDQLFASIEQSIRIGEIPRWQSIQDLEQWAMQPTRSPL